MGVDELHAEALGVVAHDAGAQLWSPSTTSVPISGRAGVPIEAPEIEMSSTWHSMVMPSASCSCWRRFVRGDALVATLVCAIELGAVGEPSQGGRELFALVLGCNELAGKAAVECSHNRAFDAAHVVEEGNYALPDVHGNR